VEDFNTPLSPIGHSDKKVNKETSELIDIIDQMDLTDIYRVFDPAIAQYKFFSAAHGTFSQKKIIF
jgi:hypothetical protein